MLRYLLLCTALFIFSEVKEVRAEGPNPDFKHRSSSSNDEMTGQETISVEELLRNSYQDRSADFISIEQAVGFYAKGSLINASEFPAAGPGFAKIARARNRQWATEDLVAIIVNVAGWMESKYPNKIQWLIGDLSQKTGGTLSGHGSHQNGLDADVSYFATTKRNIDYEHSMDFPNIYVRKGRVTAEFNLERNWNAIKALVSTQRVNRIFADRAIKRALCVYSAQVDSLATRMEILKHLRHWPGHQDHMHIRLTCPLSSPRCINQEIPPNELGC